MNDPLNPAATRGRPRRRAVSRRPPYEAHQADEVLDAYNDVFRHVPASVMEKYWDLGPERRRPWSCLTTNFRTAKYQQLRTLHERAQDICERDWAARSLQGNVLRGPTREALVAKGEALKAVAEQAPSRLQHRRLPIGLTTDCTRLGPPRKPVRPSCWVTIGTRSSLVRSTRSRARFDRKACTGWTGHHIASPKSLLNGERVMIFLNLMPDYRAPGEATAGDFSQADALPGFLQVLDAVARRYKVTFRSSPGAATPCPPSWASPRGRRSRRWVGPPW